MSLKIRYYAPFAKKSGYAQAAHDYLAALHATGQVELDIRPLVDCDTDADLHPRFQHLVPFVNREDFKPDVTVVHTIPQWANEFITSDLKPESGKTAVITTWETTKLPDGTMEKLLDFDLIIVPSQHNKRVFSSSAKRQEKQSRIAVVPHTYDPRVFENVHPVPKPSPYVFYSILVWASRKNPIGLLSAYLSAFTEKDDVLLKLLTPQYNKDDLVNLIRCMGIKDLPKVQIVTERLSDKELLNFHLDAHCYVTATRGEGWGLGSFEAAILGNRVIAPDWSGHVDYLASYANSSLYASQLTPAIATDQILGETINMGGMEIKPVSNFVATGVDARQLWAEPDLCDLQACMWEAFKYRYSRNPKAWQGEKLYSYSAVGELLLSTLKAI